MNSNQIRTARAEFLLNARQAVDERARRHVLELARGLKAIERSASAAQMNQRTSSQLVDLTV